MSGRGERRKTRDGRRTRGAGTKGVNDGLRDVRAGARRKRAHPRKRTLSRARVGGRGVGEAREGGGVERGWIKASMRGGNKERTKKVEEVGGGGWVPWSALIGSTWSDEKFNHPPIPTRPNSSSTSSSAPSPPPVPSAVFLASPYHSLFPAA